MQAYSAGFAHIYNLRWAGFARQAAAFIQDFYKDVYAGPSAGQVLDVCCGSGQFAAYFLAKGYRVVGIDLSEPMLAYARQNAQRYLENGQAAFIRADATCFAFKKRFGLVVSTYDSLNHLEDEQALRQCFECVYAVSDGYFIFDLNTRAGLRHSSGIQIDDTDEMLLIAHRLYDGQGDKAWSRITAFLKTHNGCYERSDQTAFNTIFDIRRVLDMLADTGWRKIHCASMYDLAIPLAEPEKEGRVFLVACK